MDSALRERLRQVPKAELHLHLEGSLRPQALLELSRRHGYPQGLRTLEECHALYRFTDFAGFIQAFKTVSQHLADPEDYWIAVMDLARQLRDQGVVYAEVFFSVGILHWKQTEVDPIWRAIEVARQQAEREFGVRLTWIIDAVRQFGVEHVERVVDEAIRLHESGPAVAIGIGGDEKGGPAELFAKPYRRAREAGLHASVHAGETCGAESVRAAIEHLGAERIGHGLHAGDDPALLHLLAERGIPLEICPTSNEKTGCLPSARQHPARRYFEQGVPLVVGSDDPGIFSVSLLDEYELLHDHLSFNFDELLELARNSFRTAFLSETEKAGWVARVR